MRARVFKFCKHIDSGQVYCGTEKKTDISFALFLIFSISHSNIIHREMCDKCFSGTIARRILYSLVQVLWIIYCFMWKRTRFLLLTLLLISSFFFLSNFQILKKFIFLFSGTESHTKLKPGLHMNSRLTYHVYLNRAASVYLFLYFFSFLSRKFQNIKFLVTLFCEAYKVETWYTHGQRVALLCTSNTSC